MYRVIKSLRFDKDGHSIDFIGCQAEIFHDLPQKYAVVFYGGTPFMFDKIDFLSCVEPLTEKEMTYHDILDVTIMQQRPGNTELYPTSSVRIIAFQDEDHEHKAELRLKEIFGYTKGVHYQGVKIKLVESIGTKTTEEMGKQTTPKTEVEKTESSQEVSVFEKSSTSISFPVIPKNITIGGVEFSEAAIQKEVDAVKKVVIKDPALPASQKIYKELLEKKNKFVKTRTAPENFRKGVSAPINSFLKELKAQTDAYGNLAKQGEEHCEAQIAVYENWEAEQQRLQQEAAEKQLQERRELLQTVGGTMNVAALSWTFDHSPQKLVENHEIVDLDESDFNALVEELQKSLDDHEEKEKAKQAAVEATSQALVGARKQILVLMQYTETPLGFQKNGHTVGLTQMQTLSDADWMTLLGSHNEPLQQTTAPTQVPPVAQQANAPQPAVQGGNPFAGHGGPSPFGQNNQFTAAAPSQPANPFVQSAPVVQQQSGQTIDQLAFLFTDKPYIDVVISAKSVSRLYRTDKVADASQGVEVTFNADYGNGLSNLIYKR